MGAVAAFVGSGSACASGAGGFSGVRRCGFLATPTHASVFSASARQGSWGRVRRGVVTTMGADGSYKYVVIGGGNAAGYAAWEFVKQGVGKNEVCIVSREEVAPYERPALSKAFLFKDVRLPGFHTCVGGGGERQQPEWYAEHGIDLMLNTEVAKANLTAGTKTIETKDGKSISAENVILATGASPIFLTKLDGADLNGIFYLRENADALKLAEALKANAGKTVVVVGGGYIGMEVGAAAQLMGLKVKLVFPEEHVMPRLFTPALAQYYEKFYQSKGIELLKNGRLCSAFLPDAENKGVRGILVCKDDTKEEISADMVVVGVGARPNTQLVGDQLEMENGGVKVDGNMQSSVPGVYAVGDIASFGVKQFAGKRTRMEHVEHARQSAAQAVKAAMGKSDAEYDYLPFFYSRVFDLSWVFYGDNVGECVVGGSGAPQIFAVWLEGGKVMGAFAESAADDEVKRLKAAAKGFPKAVDEAKLTQLLADKSTPLTSLLDYSEYSVRDGAVEGAAGEHTKFWAERRRGKTCRSVDRERIGARGGCRWGVGWSARNCGDNGVGRKDVCFARRRRRGDHCGVCRQWR
ncbi:Monodehydroascorbate reductase [Porphyridium purpureum]|uniref:monodehydroascorbate reductase (NADH) n=1 Tax=Porphyridium purpureum TaxID=35688 RepID=A0A5J4Z8E8_PORPP|nr:Monodehydroascorbate reductase [Porphyridium purpureum]|eukprot:POR3822..scf295_1